MAANDPATTRRSQHDPTGSVDLESPEAVAAAIRNLFDGLPGGCADPALLTRAIDDLTNAFRGTHPGILRCDTPYHDLRHALETGLTMARLLDGHARTDDPLISPIDAQHALLGVIFALYHDIGMLRRDDETDTCGARLMPIHEERSIEFLRHYLADTSLAAFADKAGLLMATKLLFKMPNDWPAADRQLAAMIATADLLSQMADRYYLEKCRDFLFFEFSAIGLAGTAASPYPTSETLLEKTPEFCNGFVFRRLEEDFDNVRRFINHHFGGADPYGDAIRRHLEFLARVLVRRDFTMLRRRPRAFIPPVAE